MDRLTLPHLEPPASIFAIGLVQAFLLLFLFFALLYDVTELALFALLLLSLGLFAYGWSRIGLHRVTCSIRPDRKRLFPGDRLVVDIRVANAKLLPVLFKVDLFIPAAVTGSEAGQWISGTHGLLWFQQTRFSRFFFPSRRGVYDLGPPVLRGGDLFGLFFREKTLAERIEVVVYPRIVDIRPMALPKREFYGTPGAKSPVEDPVYVFGTRDYEPGRPARGIHWKASARHHRLQEKLCEPAEQEKVLILLDVEGFETTGALESFERCLEVAASLVLRWDRSGTAVGFATNGRIIGNGARIVPISRSPLQMAAILESLARITAETTGSVTGILSRGYPIPWGVSVLYLAQSLSGRILAARAFMQHRHIPMQLVLAQASDDTQPKIGRREGSTLFLDDILAVRGKPR